MATISVKFRRSTVAGKAGTVFYQVIHKRRMARINTDIHIQPQDWDKLGGRGGGLDGMLSIVRGRIEADLSVVYGIIAACDRSGGEYSAKGVSELFKRPSQGFRPAAFRRDAAYAPLRLSTRCKPGVMPAPADGPVPLLAFMQERIGELEGERRYGTAANYRHTLNSLSRFIAGGGGGDVWLSMVTAAFAERYEAWLRGRGLKRNTTSFYMRVLRAVYNLAVKRGLVRQAYPFSNVYTGIDSTRKRAVDECVIARINRLDLDGKPQLLLAKDMFLFSFATCGMPFVDMAYLKQTDIKDGYLKYERRKTGQPLQVKIVPFIRDIINRYKSVSSPYVFPVLASACGANGVYRQYRASLAAYNRNLRTISGMLPAGCRITSYTARHSWATIARDHGNPASLIGKALGHTSETTTRTYLAAIGDDVVDRMNGEILGLFTKCIFPARR